MEYFDFFDARQQIDLFITDIYNTNVNIPNLGSPASYVILTKEGQEHEFSTSRN